MRPYTLHMRAHTHTAHMQTLAFVVMLSRPAVSGMCACVCVCRYDPDNVSLQRDLEELRASLAPPDTHTLKARGAARYSAGDWGGAAEAFTLLIKCLAPGESRTHAHTTYICVPLHTRTGPAP